MNFRMWYSYKYSQLPHAEEYKAWADEDKEWSHRKLSTWLEISIAHRTCIIYVHITYETEQLHDYVMSVLGSRFLPQATYPYP